MDILLAEILRVRSYPLGTRLRVALERLLRDRVSREVEHYPQVVSRDARSLRRPYHLQQRLYRTLQNLPAAAYAEAASGVVPVQMRRLRNRSLR